MNGHPSNIFRACPKLGEYPDDNQWNTNNHKYQDLWESHFGSLKPTDCSPYSTTLPSRLGPRTWDVDFSLFRRRPPPASHEWTSMASAGDQKKRELCSKLTESFVDCVLCSNTQYTWIYWYTWISSEKLVIVHNICRGQYHPLKSSTGNFEHYTCGISNCPRHPRPK